MNCRERVAAALAELRPLTDRYDYGHEVADIAERLIAILTNDDDDDEEEKENEL